MKAILIISLFLIIQKMGVNQNLYNEALKEHLVYIQQYGFGDEQGRFYVELDPCITHELPNKIGDYFVTYIDKDDIIKHAKKSGFHLVFLKPFELNNNIVIVDVIDYFVEHDGSILMYKLYGGSRLFFKYDCETEIFVLHNKEQWGL